MRTTMITLASCLLLSLTATADNVIITGESPSIPNGAIAYLFQYDGMLGTSVATDTIINGKFQLSMMADRVLRKMDVNIYQENGFSRYRRLYVCPGADINIIGNDDNIETWEVRSNVPEQAEYDTYIYANKDIIDELKRLKSEFDNLEKSAPNEESRKKAREAYKNTKAYRDSLNNIADLRTISIMRKTPVSQVWLDKMEDVVKDLDFRWDDTIDKTIKELYAELNDSIKTSKQGVKIGKLLYPDPKIEVGELFPNNKFQDLNGQEHTLQEMSDKWTVVVFWSVGCMGSHYAFQELPKLLDRHKGNLNGVLLSIDSDNWWRMASENYNIRGNNWNEGLEEIGLYRRFSHQGVPTVVLVDPEGRVADVFIGFYMDRIEKNINKEAE